ncbi:MAG: 16S rRNA (guanine(527)-N(7))-methyltransferase RsmG [Clostridia bacterium]|nr:16S rRNA (guanine(527)-N(7))-methyltransferase RsmG [Clostridia bacterium]
MEFSEFHTLFQSACRQNGISPLPKDKAEAFWSFTLHLMEVNQHTNLTAIRSIPDIITKHYVDSMLAAEYLPQGARVLDLGCGPGFPSIPLAILRPDLSIVALDSTDKKIKFVWESAVLLHLKNIEAVSGRAEDAAIRRRLGQVDALVSRAVARLNILCELCLPYLRTNGTFLAMKAAKSDEELAEAQNAIRILGGCVEQVHQKQLIAEGTTDPRTLIEIRKQKQTPPQYPRAYAAILKKPL